MLHNFIKLAFPPLALLATWCYATEIRVESDETAIRRVVSLPLDVSESLRHPRKAQWRYQREFRYVQQLLRDLKK
jgi:hypothetical protein